MTDGYTLVDLSAADTELSDKSGTPTVYLTDALGTEEVRATVRRLPPGRAMPYHHHDRQEELYVLLEGAGSMIIDGERVDATPPTVVRVPPETPRQVLNDTEDEHVWLIVGAPPVEDDGRPAYDE